MIWKSRWTRPTFVNYVHIIHFQNLRMNGGSQVTAVHLWSCWAGVFFVYFWFLVLGAPYSQPRRLLPSLKSLLLQASCMPLADFWGLEGRSPAPMEKQVSFCFGPLTSRVLVALRSNHCTNNLGSPPSFLSCFPLSSMILQLVIEFTWLTTQLIIGCHPSFVGVFTRCVW
jgi:hypothetical protein